MFTKTYWIFQFLCLSRPKSLTRKGSFPVFCPQRFLSCSGFIFHTGHIVEQSRDKHDHPADHGDIQHTYKHTQNCNITINTDAYYIKISLLKMHLLSCGAVLQQSAAGERAVYPEGSTNPPKPHCYSKIFGQYRTVA